LAAIKYQVFVSSTYEDLKNERDQVIRATLEMGHIPVGMEMFSAADEEQWKIITRQIDESDYYVVISAHRYGSMKDGVSYTEKEYDYAVEKGIPVLGFVISDDATWNLEFIDQDRKKKTALKAFKEKIKARHVSFWSAGADIYAKYPIALMKAINLTPRTGWVRGGGNAPELVNELGRLSSENSQLREHISAAEASLAIATGEIEKHKNIESKLTLLEKNPITVSCRPKGQIDWTVKNKTTLLNLFDLIAPQMTGWRTRKTLATFLAKQFMPSGQKSSDNWPVPSNNLNSWLCDYMALGFLENGNEEAADNGEDVWKLSDHGREALTSLRRRKLESSAK
jgi:hypothetical protein